MLERVVLIKHTLEIPNVPPPVLYIFAALETCEKQYVPLGSFFFMDLVGFRAPFYFKTSALPIRLLIPEV